MFPCSSKSATRKLAEEIVRFSLECGHVDELELVLDQEPATRTLVDLAAQIRRQLGYRVVAQHSKSYQKGRTARVERYIQTLRHSATLVEHLKDCAEIEVSDDHALVAWGLRHAAFLLNRFHFHASLRLPLFEFFMVMITGVD